MARCSKVHPGHERRVPETTNEAIQILSYLHSSDTEVPMARQAGWCDASCDRASRLVGNPTSFDVALAKGRYR